MVIIREKRSKTTNDVEPVKNKKKESSKFSKGKSCPKGNLSFSHKLQDHAYEKHSPFKLKEDNSLQSNYWEKKK